MSKDLDDLDMNNLSESEKQYLRDRHWLPQPPGDEKYQRQDNDWNEDEVELVPLRGTNGRNPDMNSGPTPTKATDTGAAFATSADDDGDDDGDDDDPSINEDGDPINDDGSYDWTRMNVDRLKEFCHEYELPVSGKKAELVARLEEYETMSEDEDDEGNQG